MSTTHALTLIRPWTFAILHVPGNLAKRVENRPWKPWDAVLGTRIALHAGRKYDHTAADDIAETLVIGDLMNKPRARDEGIVGTALVKGWIHWDDGVLSWSDTLTEAEAWSHKRSIWFFGPYGWVLDDVRTLATPIPCKGALSLWRMPEHVRAGVELQEATNG